MPTLVVNGVAHDVTVEPPRPLLHVLREELGLTGPKLGCAEGACGVCTVLLDGNAVHACVTPVTDAVGHDVTTIEGLAPPDGLHPLQRAVLDEAAFQCGYCTPGMILAGAALIDRDPDATDADVRTAMDGNICRCCTYPRLLRAIRRAANSSTSLPAAGAQAGVAPTLPDQAPWDLSEDDAALWEWLGDGLLVVAEDRRAWLHVGANGFVTVASGKVEVGQGSADELAGVVVGELQAAPASVRIVLGDTHVAPYDIGTFGSRTTPDVVPAVAGVAAGARVSLSAVAAAEWGVDPASVSIGEGGLTSAGGREASFAELVRGLRRVERAPAANATREIRARVMDATDVVTGRRQYASDLRLPDMLHGRLLRPPGRGALLLDLDTTAAEAIDGVRVIRDGDLVGVVAPDPLTATRGLEALRPAWSATSGPSSEELETYLRGHETTVEGWGGGVDERTGDPERALASAPIRLAATYQAAYIAHIPLETRAALARWEDGRLTVWTGTQRPFGVREALAESLGIGEESVRVVVPPTGGAYGGKHTGDAALEAARLARAAGRPVKVRWTREEETTWGYARPAAVIDVRSGAEADGTLVAFDLTNLNSGPRTLELPYRIPNVHVRYQPADGPLPAGSYRALSATANTFARESHVDEVAAAAGVDPLDMRLRQLSDDRLADVLREATQRSGWPGERSPGHAMGLACGIEKDARVATVVDVRATAGEPLQILRIVTAFECGPIVDRSNLRNQVEGAQVMALGGALFESLRLTDGRVANPRQSQYRVPRFTDVPPTEVFLLDRRDVPPAGAGETPMIALAPAIANAIFAACGVRIRSLPLVPDGIVPAA